MNARNDIVRVVIMFIIAVVVTTGALAGGSNENPFPGLLIESGWLSDNLDSDRLVVLDTGRSPEDYSEGHIPRAVFFPADQFYTEVEGLPGMFSGVDVVQQALRNAGVSGDSAIVVYDPGHGLWATRLFWTLELLGHKAIAVLNGGYGKWSSDSLAVSVVGESPEVGDFVADFQPGLVVTGEQLLDDLDDTVVVDARGRAEYEGTDVRADRGGHIPGAININWVLNNTNDEVNTFLPVQELEEFYSAELAGQEGKIVTLCQTGVRGAHTYFVLRLLGYDGVALYDGSWAEWGNDDTLPVETASEG